MGIGTIRRGTILFFIKIGGNIAGFVLVENMGSETSSLHSIAEFFVTKKYRRHGVGKVAAMKAFDLFGGRWEVMQIEKNARARAFWRNVIGEYTNGRFEERFYDGKYYQRFFARV
ncbi:GNAT family N-acetyltransferase [Cohnella kolymensis]|uniref:GNAT family N-acetyltransferase n=1 Tax=Cohnella kolymensis TaxID=1590652 RepID=UPI0009E30838